MNSLAIVCQFVLNWLEICLIVTQGEQKSFHYCKQKFQLRTVENRFLEKLARKQFS